MFKNRNFIFCTVVKHKETLVQLLILECFSPKVCKDFQVIANTERHKQGEANSSGISPTVSVLHVSNKNLKKILALSSSSSQTGVFFFCINVFISSGNSCKKERAYM